jgi:hypothetical protein
MAQNQSYADRQQGGRGRGGDRGGRGGRGGAMGAKGGQKAIVVSQNRQPTPKRTRY